MITTTSQRHYKNDNRRHKKKQKTKKAYNVKNNKKNKTPAFITGCSIAENINHKYVVKYDHLVKRKCNTCTTM